ncbi:hypothetical protein C8J57DRAFT_1141464 [Mycena rebaudengoi]|nr:hypothetical protein C8J57DRAFT_1398799 [Mycena rebaudengoi]KAJ7244953.1 hypothetical protein C8J57DRAFT_1141464 [Mycena rebaudengoi]
MMLQQLSFVFVLSLVSLPLAVMAQNSTKCATPIRDDCTFYTECLEAKYNCGTEGYPISYGFHFCTKFAESRSKLSSEGQAWISNTMLCLQNALVPEATGAPGAEATCEDLKTKAFATHAGCYVDSGLCSLPLKDWEKVSVEIVGPGTLVESLDALKATASVGLKCAKFFLEVVGDAIWPFRMRRVSRTLLYLQD